MTRDAGLEDVVTGDLSDLHDLVQKLMFGGVCWMWRGNLLCGVNSDGILARLGKGNDGWTADHPDIAPMIMGGRAMHGWVRLAAEAAGDDALRQRLLAAACRFVETLPAK